jgi:hypothetical protein
MFRMILIVVVALCAVLAPRSVRAATLDHYLCYDFDDTKFPSTTVELKDQFTQEPIKWTLVSRKLLCAPANKEKEGYVDEETHLVCYGIKEENIRVKNQLDDKNEQKLDHPLKVAYLCVPSGKVKGTAGGQGNPPPIPKGAADLAHFQCYEATGNDKIAKSYNVVDQFGGNTASNFVPRFLCNPTSKKYQDNDPTPIKHPDDHLVCYKFERKRLLTGDVLIRNQLEAPRKVLHVSGPYTMCFPSTKMRGAS